MDEPSARLRRSEVGFIVGFVVLSAAVPLVVGDIFPFTPLPMFSDAPAELTRIDVRGPDGEPRRPRDFGLLSRYLANPQPRVGLTGPDTIDPRGRALPESVIAAEVRRHLGELPWVEVTQTTFGAGPDGGATVLSQHTWRIARSGP